MMVNNASNSTSRVKDSAARIQPKRQDAPPQKLHSHAIGAGRATIQQPIVVLGRLKCHKCGRIGHIKNACRAKSTPQGPSGPSVKFVREDKNSDAGEYDLFALDSVLGRSQPFMVDVHIDAVPISMELDTGASLSIMSAATFRNHWPEKALQPTTRKLRTYTGEMLDIAGTVQVKRATWS